MTAETGILAILGIKSSAAIAAVAGAILSLILTRGLPLSVAIISLISGFVTSVYVTPMIAEYFQLSVNSENGIAFLLGLLGMNIVTGLMSMSKSFSTNPFKFISFWRRDGGDNNGNNTNN